MRNCSLRAFASVGFVVAALMALGKQAGHEKITYRTVEHKIPYHTIYKFSRTAHRGHLDKVQSGKDGYVKKVFEAKTVNGKIVSRKLIREEIIQPKDALFLMDTHGYQLSSRHQFSRGEVLTLEATAYASPAGHHRGWGRTCTGEEAKYGVVAVDPRLIPLGTLLYVEGYGFARASDIGSAIKGHRIDLCYNSYSKADDFGRRTVRVHILKSR